MTTLTFKTATKRYKGHCLIICSCLYSVNSSCLFTLFCIGIYKAVYLVSQKLGQLKGELEYQSLEHHKDVLQSLSPAVVCFT